MGSTERVINLNTTLNFGDETLITFKVWLAGTLKQGTSKTKV
jgi:hypothetical protein